MDNIQVCGRNNLCGEIAIQGSKNGTLPILAASILIRGISIIHNCPKITDVYHMIKLLESMGCIVTWQDHTVVVDATLIKSEELPVEYVCTMRSSVMLLGAMLGRMGEATLRYPGGCVIGKRPIDIHKAALQRMKVEFEEDENTICARCKELEAADIKLPFPSVGATENLVMAAVLTPGITNILNAAREPEITELCSFLKQAGANICGEGTSRITVLGVSRLHEITYQIMPDRIVAGTYLLAGAITKGIIVLEQVPVSQLTAVLQVLKNMGVRLAVTENVVCLNAANEIKPVPLIQTEVYPGFPTDLQSPLMVALSIAGGNSVIAENIFENRFRVVEELKRMGARIQAEGNKAYIYGVPKLRCSDVCAEELRGGAALVLAGLAAEGVTTIYNKHFIDRGYEDICRDLKSLGADIL